MTHDVTGNDVEGGRPPDGYALQGLKSNFRFEFRAMLTSFRGHLRDRISGLDLTIRPVQFPGATSGRDDLPLNKLNAPGKFRCVCESGFDSYREHIEYVSVKIRSLLNLRVIYRVPG